MKPFLCLLQLILTVIMLQGTAWSAESESPKTAQNQLYFSVLSDIPLMPKMKEMADQAFVFDKAEGRVVEAVGFLSAPSTENPIKYYQSTLAQLGWKPLKTAVFYRGHEQLVVKTEKLAQGVLVRFQLSPLSR